MPALIVALLWLASTPSAFAHAVADTSDNEWPLLTLLMLVAAWYVLGLAKVWKDSRLGRRQLVRRAAMFAAGWGVIAASLLTPLHELGGRSFTAHMVEHELLMMLAAPLIAWSTPLGIFIWALPARTRRSCAHVGHRRWFANTWSTLSTPLVATLAQAVAMWLWHAPRPFNAALLSEGWHTAQHLSFMGTALLFWWSLAAAASAGKPGIAAMWLFFTSLHTGLLGALMTFAASPWYPRYVELGLSGLRGLTPLEDQQLAGLIMWIPGGLIHAIVALCYLARWLRAPGAAWKVT
jgi:cytochrome c oxidase assembly factor CtaG